MYESHFGLSASPFQLSPDPSFYFDSKGHSNALAYLRFGAYQGEGFIVVTGEVGAGKTTLVRALLSELNSEKVVAAQVVTTQFEASDLLRSILSAFGVSSVGLTKAQLIASLEAFLTLLATRGQRALLIIDEAQNLNQEAVEEMRMLSNFQFGHHALLQSFLVGQPELRKLMQTKSMEQFRQRVIASCHLGPLDATETRAYIEHRLRKVGWQDRPHFEPEAFDAIFAATNGIPRRINVLCNRLLLSAYLKDVDGIDASVVADVADELRAEVGEHTKGDSVPRVVSTSPAGSAAIKALPWAEEVVRLQRTPGIKPRRPLLLVADEAVDYLKVRALAAALEPSQIGDPVVVTVRSARDLGADDELLRALPVPPLEVGLNVGPVEGAELMSQALVRFDAQLVELQPAAVAVIGSGAGVLACALTAAERAIPVLRLDGGARTGKRDATASLIDRLAAKILTRSVNSHPVLAREGVQSDRVECVGSLWNSLIGYLPSDLSAAEVLRRFGVPASTVESAQAFGLLTLSGSDGRALARQVDALCAQLKGALPLLWPVDQATADAIRTAALDSRLERFHIAVLPATTVADRIALLRNAALLISDAAAQGVEEAGVLHVPVLELAADGANADALAHAVGDLLATPRTHTTEPTAQRVIDTVTRWLKASAAPTPLGNRVSNGPQSGR